MEGSRLNTRTRRPRWAWAVRGASGLAVASAVSAAAAADAPRAVVMLPPRVGAPAPGPVVARGAIDDNPMVTTPVVRKGMSPAGRPLVPPTAAKAPAPDWLSGVDPNVIPAGGSVPAKAATSARLTGESRSILPTTPPAAPTKLTPTAGSPRLTPPPPLFQPGEPNPLAKGVEAFKGFVSPDAGSALAPAGSPQPDARSPGEPLQGTGSNGAPVLAGPPAWRWYGYGSVTPGANAYAPGGQYPRASANWYSVTKATPGAFPVPVVNPFRGGPGAEPPNYAGMSPVPTRTTLMPAPADNTMMPPPRLNPVPTPTPVSAPVGGTKLGAMPTFEPVAALPPVPTLTPISTPAPVAAAPFQPIPLPAPPSLTPPPAVKAPEPLAAAPLPMTTVEPPPAARPSPPPILPPLSVMPVASAPVSAPVAAVPLVPTPPVIAPVSAPAASEDDIGWKSNPTHRPTPAPGTWVQPADRARPDGQPGASAAPRLPIARGQIGDEVQQPADPVEPVVQAVCRGRATGIDVRHTGPRQVTVCFEARTQTDATALVRDLSARPELAPYAVNFCVLVK